LKGEEKEEEEEQKKRHIEIESSFKLLLEML
jgi:hypothetical protein